MEVKRDTQADIFRVVFSQQKQKILTDIFSVFSQEKSHSTNFQLNIDFSFQKQCFRA